MAINLIKLNCTFSTVRSTAVLGYVANIVTNVSAARKEFQGIDASIYWFWPTSTSGMAKGGISRIPSERKIVEKNPEPEMADFPLVC